MYELRRIETEASRAELPLYTDRAEARSRLATTLDAIAAFAAKEKLGWETTFRAARKTLDELPADNWVNQEFCDAGLGDAAVRLLAAAWQADVFGGMGSWNDVYVDDRDAYGNVSQALHASLRPAVEAAINGQT